MFNKNLHSTDSDHRKSSESPEQLINLFEGIHEISASDSDEPSKKTTEPFDDEAAAVNDRVLAQSAEPKRKRRRM
jgi:hypothetical protein